MRCLIYKRLLLILLCSVVGIAFYDRAWSINTNALESRRKNAVLRQLRALELVAEVELRFSPAVMPLLTTTTGTVEPLLLRRGAAPAWLKPLARKLGYGSMRDVRWDALDYEQKFSLIWHSVKDQDFFASRRIRGLQLRPWLRLTFDEPTVLFGASYVAGTYDVAVRRFLQPYVELMSARTNPPTGIEIHLRHDSRPSQMLPSVHAFLKAAGLPKRSMHLHIPGLLPVAIAPLPRRADLKRFSRREEQSLLSTFSLVTTEFVRQVELLAQFLSIFDSGNKTGRLRQNIQIVEGHERVAENIRFAPMTAENLVVFLQHLQRHWDYRRAIAPQNKLYRSIFLEQWRRSGGVLGDEVKQGWIGPRGYDFYEYPGLWGIEYRAIGADANLDALGVVLDAIQRHLDQQLSIMATNHGESLEAWDQYLRERRVSLSGGFYLAWYHWYNKHSQELREAPHRLLDFEAAIAGGDAHLTEYKKVMAAQIAMGAQHVENTEIKMLYHDWRWDPLFYDDPKALDRIALAQSVALSELQTLPADAYPEIRAIMQRFIVRSGLLQTITESLGVPMSLITSLSQDPRQNSCNEALEPSRTER